MFWFVLILAILAVLVGARALLIQFQRGLSSTGLSDRFSWGVYIQGFLTLGSLAGGVLLLSGIAGVFGLGPLVGPYISPLVLACLAGAGVMILADLGKPFRSVLLMLLKNLDSTMTWDFVTFALSGLMAVLAWFFGMTRVASSGIWTVWGVLSVLFAAVFLIVHVLLLLSRKGNPVSQPFLAFEIFFRGLWGGAALITVFATVHPTVAYYTAPFLLVFSIIVTLSHFAANFAKTRPENAPRRSLVSCITVADLVVVVLLVISMLVDGSRWLTVIAGILSVAILVLEKRHLLYELQEDAVLPAPYSQWQARAPYKPSAGELQVVIGSIGMAVAVGLIASKLLPVFEFGRGMGGF